MLIKKYFEMVETVLNRFPVEYLENYFNNKSDIIIHYRRNESKDLEFSYEYKENEIIVYKEEELLHALFCMAFRDKMKVGRRVLQNMDINTDIYYDNGVAFRKRNVIRNKGLTQGFVEYLVSICTNEIPPTINGYFVDLLILVHGEDIIKYPFLNDPIGFFKDKRFFNITKFCDQLDSFNDHKTNMSVVKNYRDDFIDILQNEEKDTVQKMYSIFKTTIKEYKVSIVGLFNSIINEYKHCENPNIDINNFIKKLENFLSAPEYAEAFKYDNEEYSVKEHVINLINSVKEDKNLFEKKSQYIKKEETN